jgi:hypothetical protein
MRVIYTYCTQNGTNLFGGYNSLEDLILMFKKSIAGIELTTQDITIYTDLEGSHVLDQNGITNTKVVVDFDSYNYDKRFWNIPKLVSYAMQEEWFLHLDIDVVFDAKIDIDLTQFQFVSEMQRAEVIPSHHRNWLPKVVQDNYHPYIACSGIYGGDPRLFKKLLEIALKTTKQFTEADEIRFDHLTGIEETVATVLARCNNLDTHYINTGFTHYQGREAKAQFNTENTTKNIDLSL